MKRFTPGLAAMLLIGIALVSGFGIKADRALGAAAPPQCNGEMNENGNQVACTVVIVNYVDVDGDLALTPDSTMTMTRCVGAAGPVNTLTCDTPVVTVLTAPVTSVSQCNGSGSGGGGIVRCSVSITNHFAGQNPALTPATVYQCVGSVITGTGAPGLCTPANTPGVTSIGEATVGQCNGSGNGGTSVGFTCTVTGSSLPLAMPINIDQCNGSANGGGALTECFVTFTEVFAAPPTQTVVTATPSGVPATPTESPTQTPPAPVDIPPEFIPPSTPTIPALQTPPPQATPTVPAPYTTPQAQVPPTRTPSATPGTPVPPSSTPFAPSTGSTPASGNGTTPGGSILLIGFAMMMAGFAGFRFFQRSR